MTRRFFPSTPAAPAAQAPGAAMTMTLQLRKPVDCPVVRVDPNDGSPVVEVQPGGNYTCPAGAACSPMVSGIVWDSCGCDTAIVYLSGMEEGLLAVARVDGDTCGETLAWHWTFDPEAGPTMTDYEGCPSAIYEVPSYYPQVVVIGGHLAVISATSFVDGWRPAMPGVLSVTAVHGGITYGPIMLLIYGFTD